MNSNTRLSIKNPKHRVLRIVSGHRFLLPHSIIRSCSIPMHRLLNSSRYTTRSSPPRRQTARVDRNNNNNQHRPSASSAPQDPHPSTSFFPAGRCQGKVQLPALFITISASEVTSSIGSRIDGAIRGGATAIVLSDSGTGAGQLYEAAIRLKDIIRGRAALLVQDRTDVVDLSGADGALLSADGLPTVSVKRILQNGLSLVGRMVLDAQSAIVAAADGANFLVLQPPSLSSSTTTTTTNNNMDGDGFRQLVQASKNQKSGSGSVPILATIHNTSLSASLVIESGVDGIILDFDKLRQIASSLESKTNVDDLTDEQAATLLVERLASYSSSTDSSALLSTAEATKYRITTSSSSSLEATDAEPLAKLLATSSSLPQKNAVIEEERSLLTEILYFLEVVCPNLEETSLLRDAIKQLDEPFLLVVVGEFNSGKTAVINALLGQKLLSEGVLPTTNEINVIKYDNNARDSHDNGDTISAVESEDGLVVRYIKAPVLQTLSIVDTPGTNVILERQQRLSEEFVPRADLVLFVMSADRPMTESEVAFLKYIRKWGKKVVFVINKVDILASDDEVEEVAQFVRDNTARLLGVQGPQVLAVSARMAIKAKLAAAAAAAAAASSSSSGGKGGSMQHQMEKAAALMAEDSQWTNSKFGSLERFIYKFLVGDSNTTAAPSSSSGVGGVSGGGERARLKLQTPLFVADALLEASRQALVAELEIAKQDAATVALVKTQLEDFRREMEKEGDVQRKEAGRVILDSAKKAAAVVDSTLQLSNVDVLAAYILGKSDSAILPVARRLKETAGASGQDAAVALKGVLREHSSWVGGNCRRQMDNYRLFAQQRAAALGKSLESLITISRGGEGLTMDAEGRKLWRAARGGIFDEETVLQLSTFSSTEDQVSSNNGGSNNSGLVSSLSPSSSTNTVLDPAATVIMLEEEVRSAVLGTAGTAAGAGAMGLVLTSVLPTTLEDLLALALAGAVGYASVLSLPLRRTEAKRKLEEAAQAGAKRVQQSMEEELQGALRVLEREVGALVAPLEALTAAEIESVEAAERKRGGLGDRLESLKRQVAAVE
jgi:small GTP-binding protein